MPIMSSSSSSSSKSWILNGVAVGAAMAAALGARAYLTRSGRFRSRVIGIIPARFASTRFQGKPLVHILGKHMIQRTWERAKLAASLDHIVVATDDEKIAECCQGFGAEVIMTSESCRNVVKLEELSVVMKLFKSLERSMILSLIYKEMNLLLNLR